MAAIEDKQLNFNQPLLSVKKPLPYYKSDLKSGPITNPGSVPFQWEKIPGRAKAPKIPTPGRVFDSSHSDATYTDALSRTGSSSSGTLLDPQSQDFMMDRFLPAAKAVAFETPHSGSRKQQQPPANTYHTHTNLPRHQQEEDVDTEEGNDDDNEFEGAEIAPNRFCGLLPRFCMLNPIPGMKDQASVHNRHSNSGVYKKSERAVRNATFERRRLHFRQRFDLEDEMRKNKSQNPSLKLDQLLKIATVESTTDIAPFRSVSRHSPMDKDKGLLGLPERAGSTKVNPQTRGFKIFRELLADDAAADDVEEYYDTNSSPSGSNKLCEPRKSCQLPQLTWKENDEESKVVKNPPGPPLLPKSPSESWLSRAVHSRYICRRPNPVTTISPSERRWEAVVKCSTMHSRSSCGVPARTS